MYPRKGDCTETEAGLCLGAENKGSARAVGWKLHSQKSRWAWREEGMRKAVKPTLFFILRHFLKEETWLHFRVLNQPAHL